MKNIVIAVEALAVPALLNDSETAERIYEALPLEGTVRVWGEEIYFEIPLQIGPAADARQGVAVGDLGYWPAGPAFCIFFGPTPVSTDERPRAYSPVNIFGRVTGDSSQFKTISDGCGIRVSRT